MYVRGKHVILAMVGLGVLAASAAVWLSIRQFARMTETWGRPAAELIHHAPVAEICRLSPVNREIANGANEAVVRVGQDVFEISDRKNGNDVPGFLNLRRSLLEERAFDWTETQPVAESTEHRVIALTFRNSQREGQKEAVVVIDLVSGVVRLVGSEAKCRLIPEIAREFTLFTDRQFPAKTP